jgi:hypothetical protein
VSQTIEERHPYPEQDIRVFPFTGDLAPFYIAPRGWLFEQRPSEPLAYLSFYLDKLACKTVLVESHYIDKDYLIDLSIYYSRSLSDYPNYCRRLHFFKEAFDQERWKALIQAANRGGSNETADILRRTYLGFTIQRPLERAPIGRTVLPPLADGASDFGAVRSHEVHVAGIELAVRGLAFQQQDQGVSACATTALWSALNCVASKEGLPAMSPGQITQAASRYYLAGGRPLPSEGLNIQQICEATRAAELSPVLHSGTNLAQDVAQLHGYVRSGFPAVLALQPYEPTVAPPQEQGSKHAVCAAGLKLGEVLPQHVEELSYRDGASETKALYVHDDRLGPYKVATLHQYTWKEAKLRTSLVIKWVDGVEDEASILEAIIVPLPSKIRLTIPKMRQLAIPVANAFGQLFSEFPRTVTFSCRYMRATEYTTQAFMFDLSDEGIYQLNCKTALSRYVGLIEITAPQGPLLDILLDATEAQPVARAIVRRHALPAARNAAVAAVARKLATNFLA